MYGPRNPGRYREVAVVGRFHAIRVKRMDRRTVGTKNPGRCREVAVSGGSPFVVYTNKL